MKKEDNLISGILEASLLYDFYGQLLSKRQQQVLALYYEENFSLSEIAEEFGISRQGVHDTLKKAEAALHQYERKLGLVNRLLHTENKLRKLDRDIDDIIIWVDREKHNDSHIDTDGKITKKLHELKDTVKGLEA